jgi:hypothetical protein
MVEDRVLNRADAGSGALGMTVPAEYHEVGAG